MSIKRYKVIFDGTAAETGEWFALDVRYDESPSRAIQVQVTSGDTIKIQAITKDVKGIDKSFLDELDADDIADLKTYSASEADTLDGPWTYIRAIKTGTTGPAKVSGFI